jgi:hypothetical protein
MIGVRVMSHMSGIRYLYERDRHVCMSRIGYLYEQLQHVLYEQDQGISYEHQHVCLSRIRVPFMIRIGYLV